MTIQINNYIDLLEFIKRDDINRNDALTVFEKALNIVCITFVDAITKIELYDKCDIINELEKIIATPDYVPSHIFLFSKNPLNEI